MALHRITITIPRDVLAAADRRARDLNRSRSWVVAEALRGYVRAPAVREPEAPAYAAGAVADARRRHLETDLALPVAERLRRAEELAQLGQAQRRSRSGRRQQIIGFDNYEDFYEWKRARHAGA